MMPAGWQLLISSRDAVQGRTTEKTFSSRIRRAISWVYCEPKSRMTMDCSSTNNFARFAVGCKAQSNRTHARLSRIVRAALQGQFVTLAINSGERFYHTANGEIHRHSLLCVPYLSRG